MLGALAGLLKPILAVSLVAGATAVIVAPSLDMARTRAESAVLNHASATPAVETDAPELDFETLLLACLDSFDPDSQACAYAQDKSGMTRDEFRAKIVEKLRGVRRTPEPTADATVPPTSAPVKTTTPKPTVKATPKPTQEDFWTVFDTCLDTRVWTSDICKRAQALIGFNDSDFHAKFDRYLAERDAKSASPSPKPTASPTPRPTASATSSPSANASPAPTATTLADAVRKACWDTHDRTSAMCLAAIAMSGLSEVDFWAKLQADFGPF